MTRDKSGECCQCGKITTNMVCLIRSSRGYGTMAVWLCHRKRCNDDYNDDYGRPRKWMGKKKMRPTQATVSCGCDKCNNPRGRKKGFK